VLMQRALCVNGYWSSKLIQRALLVLYVDTESPVCDHTIWRLSYRCLCVHKLQVTTTALATSGKEVIEVLSGLDAEGQAAGRERT